MARNGCNGLKWPEMAGLTENGWKMAGNGRKLQEMAENGRKNEIAG